MTQNLSSRGNTGTIIFRTQQNDRLVLLFELYFQETRTCSHSVEVPHPLWTMNRQEFIASVHESARARQARVPSNAWQVFVVVRRLKQEAFLGTWHLISTHDARGGTGLFPAMMQARSHPRSAAPNPRVPSMIVEYISSGLYSPTFTQSHGPHGLTAQHKSHHANIVNGRKHQAQPWKEDEHKRALFVEFWLAPALSSCIVAKKLLFLSFFFPKWTRSRWIY